MLFIEKQSKDKTVSRFSVGLLFIATFFLFVSSAEAANLSLVPSGGSGSYGVGQIFTVPVFVSTSGGEAMNAVSAVVSFPQNILQLVSVDKNGSIIDFWIGDSSYSNNDGKAHFEGGVYNPGYSGDNGKVVSLVFRAKAIGSGSISFSSASVLANDGKGTNILSETGTASISIKAAPTPVNTANTPSTTMPEITIYSSTHPDQNKWYNSTAASLSWRLPSGTSAVRTLLDGLPDSIPTTVSSPPVSDIDLTLKDGVSYFHLQGRDATGWGRVSHFRMQVDTTAVSYPLIEGLPDRLTVGQKLYVRGKAEPNVLVTVYLKGGSGQVSEQSIQSNEDGKFSLVWQNQLPVDAYNISSKATNNHGIDSPRSPNILLLVEESAITRVGWPILNILTLILLALTLFVGVLVWIWYITHHVSRFQRRVKNEVKEADRHIRQKFKKLESVVLEQIRLLEEAQDHRKLTAHEQKIINALGRAIEETEEEVEKEVSRIGR